MGCAHRLRLVLAGGIVVGAGLLGGAAVAGPVALTMGRTAGISAALAGNDLFVPGGDVAPDALALLRASEPARRRQGIDQLDAHLDGPAARETTRLIIERLGDSDGGVRARAAQVLGRRGVMEAAGALLDRLGDPDSTVRAASAEGLGHYGALPPGLSGRAAAALGRALGDAGFEVRLEALRSLESLLSLKAIADEDRAALVGPVLLRVDDENVGVRRAAVAVLGKLGPMAARRPGPGPGPWESEDPAARVVVPLLGRLSDSARNVRAEAVASLAGLFATAATPAVMRLLRDPAEEVRRQAMLCLGRFGVTAAVPALAGVLASGSDALRTAAATALGQIGQGGQAGQGQAGANDLAARRGAVSALAGALAHEDLRPVAREALLAVGPPAVPVLVERLAQDHAGQEEVEALVDLLADLSHAGDAGRAAHAGAAGEAEAASPATLRRQAAAAVRGELSRDRIPREVIIDALGRIGDRDSAALFAGLLLDGDQGVRRHAIRALRRPGILDERALDALLAATRDTDGDVRVQAVTALGELPVPAAGRALGELAQRGDAATRAAAAQAIGTWGGPIAGLSGPLSSALVHLVVTFRPGDEERGARRSAAEALARLVARSAGTPGQQGLLDSVVPALTAPLRAGVGRQESAALEIVAALGGVLRGRVSEIGRETLLSLAQTGAEAHTQEAALALDALGALGALRDPASASRLQRLITHGDPLRRVRAAFALGCLLADTPTDGAVQALLSALGSDADGRVRAEAAWALGRLRPGARQLGKVVTGLRQALSGNHGDWHESDAALRANAAAALTILGQGEAGDADLLTSPDPAVRANGALLLGLVAPASAGLQARLRALGNTDGDHRVRRSTAGALTGRAQALARAGAQRRHWLLLDFVDYDRQPLAETRYRLTTPDGLIRVGLTDGRGRAPEELLMPGRCDWEIVDEEVKPH